jgi:hypothetical protein
VVGEGDGGFHPFFLKNPRYSGIVRPGGAGGIRSYLCRVLLFVFEILQNERVLPASGPLAGHGGASECQDPLTDPPRGRPVGGGGTHRNQRKGGINPHCHELLYKNRRIMP